MAHLSVTIAPAKVRAVLTRAALGVRREQIALAAILVVSAGLNLVGIDRNGLSNTYYAATVKSMGQSWHNWFFAAFDPGGFITVDKPPVGFWVQSLSVRLLGFNGVALIVPQAIAGVASVGLLYLIVRRQFGEVAALIGAFILAITPISVVTNRSNTLESFVVLLLLGATYATLRAMQHGALVWLIVAGGLIGLAFNVKMLEAYLVVPALGVAYGLTAPIPWRARLGHLTAALGVLLGVSSLWITAVDLTPASARPYVGSSYHNSELDLVWLYNGIQRLNGTPWSPPVAVTDPRGLPGPLRLIIPPLAGQGGWFLPLALPVVALAARVPWRSYRGHLSQKQGALVLWGLWLAPMVVFFSAAHFFNGYYLALLSPAVAALVGIGVTTGWAARKGRGWEGWLLVGGVSAVAVEQGSILTLAPFWLPWLTGMVALLWGLFIAAWLSLRFVRFPDLRRAQVVTGVSVSTLAGTLCLAPLLWSLASLHPDSDPGFPHAGPTRTGVPAATVPLPPAGLLTYLRQGRDQRAFLVATVDARTAVPFILATGAPVMALGGYSGFDPVLTPATLARHVARHTIRFFWLPASNLSAAQIASLYPQGPAITPHVTNALTQWVAQHCQTVPPSQWGAPPDPAANPLTVLQLFDCATASGGASG